MVSPLIDEAWILPRSSIPRILGALILVVLLLPSGLWGQQQEDLPPLRKSDVVLMLTSRDLSEQELASIIRSRCLTFEPTETDLNDFRRLGAGDAVIEAARTCDEDEEPEGMEQPARTPARTPEPVAPDIAVVGSEFAAGGGETIRIRVTRGGAPADGLPVTLFTRPPVSDSVRVLTRGTSGAMGLAALRVPPGELAESYVVRAGSGPGPAATATITVQGPYGEASATPLRVTSPSGFPGRDAGTGRLALVLTDSVARSLAGAGGAEAGGPRAGTVIRFEGDPVRFGVPADPTPRPETPARERTAGDAGYLLGRAEEHRRAGDLYLAKKALRSALERRPNDTIVRRKLRELRNVDPWTWAEGAAWGGGSSGELDYRTAPRLQALEARVSPVPGTFSLSYRFDNGLNLERSEMVRGPTVYMSHYGGVSLRYAGGTMVTRASVGRRKQPPRPFNETTVSLDHAYLLGSPTVPDFERIRVGLGGTWGRWGSSVEHDLFFRAFGGFPVSSTVRTDVALHYSESIGTVPSTEDWRSRAQELRLELRPVLRSGDSRLEVGLAYGNVEAVPDEKLGQEEGNPRFSGSLWNLETHGTLPLGNRIRLEGFYRWQSAPGYPAFTVFGLGLSTGIPY